MCDNLYHAFGLDEFTGREHPHVLNRHAVRKYYRTQGWTWRMIANLEATATGRRPNRATLIHSVRIADEKTMRKVYEMAWKYGISA